jgi:hypothetical protein
LVNEIDYEAKVKNPPVGKKPRRDFFNQSTNQLINVRSIVNEFAVKPDEFLIDVIRS